MGDETIEIASRFSTAVSRLALLAGGGEQKLAKAHGRKLAEVLRDALDAVGAVYESGTKAVRNWPEQSRKVNTHLASMREVLDRSGVDAELRRLARELVELIEPGSGGG